MAMFGKRIGATTSLGCPLDVCVFDLMFFFGIFYETPPLNGTEERVYDPDQVPEFGHSMWIL